MPLKRHFHTKRNKVWVVDEILTNGSIKLAPKGRLKFDHVRQQHLLLLPEKVVVLNETAASILTLCNGNETVDTVIEKLGNSLDKTYASQDFVKMKEDITRFLQEMVDQGWVIVEHEHVTEK